MFWGLIMEPGKKYSQTVEKSFHVSHAALDIDTAQTESVQVLLGFENRNYLLCTLKRPHHIQVSLDLNFQAGDKVSFATNGPGHVHLTGYLVPEDDMYLDEEVDEEVEEEEEDDDEEVPNLVPAVSKKRPASEIAKKEGKASKKSKTEELLDAVDPNKTDDSDDSDVSLTDILEMETGEEVDEEDDDDDEDNDDDDEDDDDDDDDDDEVEEEEEEVKKKQQTPKKEIQMAKQNGVVKKLEKTPKGEHKTPKGDQKTPKGDQKTHKGEQKTPQSPKQKGEKTPQSPKQKGEKTPKNEKQKGNENATPGKKHLEGGVVIEDLKIGEGAIAKPGKFAQVYYEGRLKSNNKLFDSSTKGPGFKFRLGRQEVIKGWDIGVTGMKVGGKRRITCPPQMAYGAQGSPPVIPPNSALVFEVELKHVK